jgi:hypothetical protein
VSLKTAWCTAGGGGLLYLNFRQPEYTRFYTFRDFCREAAEDLLFVAGFIEEE